MISTFYNLFFRDRVILISGVLILFVLSWGYTINMVQDMALISTGRTMITPHIHVWHKSDLLMAIVMWSVMMVGMMLPSILPWILTLSGMRKPEAGFDALANVSAFLLGYLSVWISYSILAGSLQWLLHQYALLSTAMVSTNSILGGMLLILAGLYQWSPIKDICLKHCRSPMGFFLASWKEGRWGAVQMGFQHGLFCVGCCWALMLLSFVAGVMNLLWMVIITLFIFIDHATSAGKWLGKGAGGVLIGWGFWLLVG